MGQQPNMFPYVVGDDMLDSRVFLRNSTTVDAVEIFDRRSLRLSADALQVDDRGYALDGTLLYGSPDGGPYRLARVQGTRDQGGDP